MILIKIGRGLSLLSLGRTILDSNSHQKSPVFRSNEFSFESPGRGRCHRNLRIIRNYLAKNKIKVGAQNRDCTWGPSDSFYLGLSAGLIVFPLQSLNKFVNVLTFLNLFIGGFFFLQIFQFLGGNYYSLILLKFPNSFCSNRKTLSFWPELFTY